MDYTGEGKDLAVVAIGKVVRQNGWGHHGGWWWWRNKKG